MGLNDAIDGIGEALEKSVKSENNSKNDIRETAKKSYKRYSNRVKW